MSSTVTLAGVLAERAKTSLLDYLGGQFRRALGGAEAENAIRDSLRAALAKSLEEVETPSELADSAETRQHFADLLGALLDDMEVLEELSRTLDPRSEKEADFARALHGIGERSVEVSHFPDFDFLAFLECLESEFFAAASSEPLLQERIGIRQRGALIAATERSAEGIETISKQVAQLTESVEAFLADGSETRLLSVQQVFLGDGDLLQMLQGYEAIVGVLQEHGLVVEPTDGGQIVDLQESASPGDDPRSAQERAARRTTLRDLLGTFRHALTSAEPSEEELAGLEARYRQHLIRSFENLTFRGMMRTGKPIVLPLETVYVELRSVAEVPETADTFSVDERRLLLEIEDGDERLDPEKHRELMGQLDALRRERWSETLPERRSIGEALHASEHRAFVILGDPGSGKTTLLHYRALSYARGAAHAAEAFDLDEAEADRLPIFVPLASFDDMRRRDPSLTLREFLARYYDARHRLPGLGPLFERALASGRALLLFDGLDEVVEVHTRAFVSERVASLVAECAPRGARFVLSSLVVGYREAPVVGDVTTLTVLDFGERDIEVFVHQWARAFETWAASGEESPEVLREAAQLEKDLMIDVRSNASVRRLAANPLMLTMLALIRRQVGRLPHRRIQLYEIYVSTLLENWIENRSPQARELPRETFDKHRAENLLIPLALWLQETKPSGTAGVTEMRRRLTDLCLEEAGLDRESAERPALREAEAEADRFLKEMRETSGLLVERGHDAFGFLHLTFQEYFAGRALALLSREERWHTVEPHLHDPRWREPLMLCAGRLGVMENRRDEVTDFVRRIFERSDEAEPHLRRNLLLALAIACDDVSLEPRLMQRLVDAGIEALSTNLYGFGRQVLGYLVQLVANGHADLDRCLDPVWKLDRRRRKDAIQVLGRFLKVEAIRRFLVDRSREDDDYDVRQSALSALASHVGSDPEIRNATLQALEDQHFRVRRSALRALASHVGSDPEIRNATLQALEDPDEDVRQSALSGLASHVEGDPEIRQATIKALEDQSEFMIHLALSALASDIGSDSEVREATIKAFKDRNYFGRQLTLRAMASLVGSDPEIRQITIKALEDKDPFVRRVASSTLASHVESDPDIRQATIRALEDPHEYVRQATLSALASHAESDPEFRQATIKALKDPSYKVRQSTLSALAGHVGSDSEIQQVIIQTLEDPSYTVRQETLNILVSHVESDPEIRQATIKALDDRAWQVRRVALQGLARSTTAWRDLEGFFSITVSDDSWEYRKSAAELLGEEGLETWHWRTIRKLLDTTQAEQAAKLYLGEIHLLLSFILSYPKLRNRLLAYYSSRYSTIRRSVLCALANHVESDPEIRQATIKALKDQDLSVRCEALNTLARHVESNPEVRQAAIKALEDPSYSVRHLALSTLANHVENNPEVRKSALRALKALEHPNVYVRESALRALANNCVQNNPEIRKATIKALKDDEWSVRSSALNALASHVESNPEVRQATIKELKDHYSVPYSVLCALASHVESDPEIRQVTLEALEGSHSFFVRGSTLSALASHVKNDPEIRQATIKALEDQHFDVRESALSALASHVGSDPEIRQATIKTLEDQHPGVRAEALSALASHVKNDLEIRKAAIKALEDQDYPVRLKALEILVESAEESVIPRATLLAWISLDVESHAYPSLAIEKQAEATRAKLAGHLAQALPDAELEEALLAKLDEIRWSSRLGAMLTLVAWPGGPPEPIVERIVEALGDMRGLESYPARITAASYLLNRDESSRDAIDLCLEALDYGTEPWEHLPKRGPEIRKQAALVLGKLEPVHFHADAYDKLLHVMQNDEDGDVRDAAYDALVRLARARDIARLQADPSAN